MRSDTTAKQILNAVLALGVLTVSVGASLGVAAAIAVRMFLLVKGL
jgi:hypothetical protein